MARGRMLAHSVSTSKKFNALYAHIPALADFCQLLYLLLVPHADDRGRCPGDAWTVKHRVLPLSPHPVEEFDQALVALDHVGLIHRYAIAQRQFLAITQFEAHQDLRPPLRSQLPPPPGVSDAESGPDGTGPGRDQVAPAPAGRPDETGPPRARAKEGRKEGRKEDRARGGARPLRSAAPYLSACDHTPPCTQPWVCGLRRQVDQSLRVGTITPAAAARLVRLYQADGPPRPADAKE